MEAKFIDKRYSGRIPIQDFQICSVWPKDIFENDEILKQFNITPKANKNKYPIPIHSLLNSKLSDGGLYNNFDMVDQVIRNSEALHEVKASIE